MIATRRLLSHRTRRDLDPVAGALRIDAAPLPPSRRYLTVPTCHFSTWTDESIGKLSLSNLRIVTADWVVSMNSIVTVSPTRVRAISGEVEASPTNTLP